jgi:chromosome segregation ATPase
LKDKEMSKLKTEMKKLDSQAQDKIGELRKMQQRALVSREKKAKLEEAEMEAKGIDIDLITNWIQTNTQAMLKKQELKEYLDKKNYEKDKLETEMLEEGDKLTELYVQKEQMEFEIEEIEEMEDKDEGRLLVIQDDLKDINLETTSIIETLDMLEETLEFLNDKID